MGAGDGRYRGARKGPARDDIDVPVAVLNAKGWQYGAEPQRVPDFMQSDREQISSPDGSTSGTGQDAACVDLAATEVARSRCEARKFAISPWGAIQKKGDAAVVVEANVATCLAALGAQK
jgi:hypothetical protein